MEQEEEYYDSQEEYFVDCCRAGELDEVKELLKDEALKIVWTSEDNNNCLRTFFSKEDMAAANGHLEVLKTIFEFIANKPTIKQELLNGKNCDEDYATICGKQDVIELLLKEGADPNITNECGRTAMREAYLLNNFEIGVILAKVTKADQEEFRPEYLVECEAANERVDEYEEYGENEYFEGEYQQNNYQTESTPPKEEPSS